MNTNAQPVDNLLSEYEAVVAESGRQEFYQYWGRLKGNLVSTSEWSPPAAEHLVALARNYGSFVLRNAYALALALDIEDGELGL